jgi:hypothetical protein
MARSCCTRTRTRTRAPALFPPHRPALTPPPHPLTPAPQAPGTIKLSVKWTDASALTPSQAGSANSDASKGKTYLIQRCSGTYCRFPTTNVPFKTVEAKVLGPPDKKAGTLEWLDKELKYREIFCYRVMTCVGDKLCSPWSSQGLCGEAI